MAKVRFIRKIKLTDFTWEFIFTPVDFTWDYLPGQYARFRFPYQIHDPRTEKQHRTFTLINLPSDPELRFVTRLPEPHSVYKTHLFALQPGDTMEVDEPLGDVVLPRSPDTPLIFVAAGIGIASFVAMLRAVEQSGKARDITLLYGYREPADRTFGNLLDRFVFASRREFISPVHITATDILAAGTAKTNPLYYISGPERFVEPVRAELETHGLDHSRIIFDYFTGY